MVVRLLLLVFAIRLLEYGYFSTIHPDELSLSLFIERSANYDFLLILLFSIIYLPIYLVTSSFLKMALSFFKILSFIFTLINLFLTDFFVLSHFLLPSLFFEFSITDIVHVIQMETNMSNWHIWLINVVFIILSYRVLFSKPSEWINNIKYQGVLILVYLVLSTISLFNRNHTYKEQKYFSSDFQYSI